MKKKLLTIAVTAAMVLSLVACGPAAVMVGTMKQRRRRQVRQKQQLRVLFLTVMVRKH